MAVEFLVLLVGDLRFGLGPDRGAFVHAVGDALGIRQRDGEADMVGVGARDMAEAVAVEIFFCFGLHVQGDAGAAAALGGGRDFIRAHAIGFPLPGIALARFAAGDGDFIGHHERRIKAHAELADEVDVFGRVATQPLQEFAGAGFGDGAEIGDQVVTVHADAAVFDGQRVGLGVDAEFDGEVGLVAQ